MLYANCHVTIYFIRYIYVFNLKPYLSIYFNTHTFPTLTLSILYTYSFCVTFRAVAYLAIYRPHLSIFNCKSFFILYSIFFIYMYVKLLHILYSTTNMVVLYALFFFLYITYCISFYLSTLLAFNCKSLFILSIFFIYSIYLAYFL